MNHSDESEVILDVKDLDVSFYLPRGELRAVRSISYSVKRGETMGLVGESGSGKSVEAYSILGLIKPPAKINGGSALYEGKELLALSNKELESFRGSEISMIFQNPMSFLDPIFKIGQQMVETIFAHDKYISKSAAKERSLEMLREVRIRNPEQVLGQYPFQLSGGMRQRVMIAIALLCRPKLLIADEPTTALDVTIQSQVIQILKELQRQSGMTMVYITHNFGIVAELCDTVSVMCGGYILEQGTTDDIFYRAAHPYTQLMLKTIPRMDAMTKEPFLSIEGPPLDPFDLPRGCVFSPRCPSCTDRCRESVPPKTLLSLNHSASCWQLNS